MVQNNGHAGAVSEADVVWTSLSQDTNLPVVVVDVNGTIEFANPPAAQLLESGSPLVGRRLSEFYNEDLAAEMLVHVREAATGRGPVMVEGMIKGRMYRTTCRVMAAQPGRPGRVLMVSRLAASVFQDGGANIVRTRTIDAGPLSNLTAREVEILKLIGVGLSTAQIAKKLGRSVKTVEWHRVSLGDKLGVTNRVELARIAIAAGMVGLDEPMGLVEEGQAN